MDPDARVRYWFGGVPGSTHDSRLQTIIPTIPTTSMRLHFMLLLFFCSAFRQSRMMLRPIEYFSAGEHLLADSAYANSSYVVSCYKRSR